MNTATNIKIQTAIQQVYVQSGTPPIRTNPPVVEPDRESCNIRDYVLGIEYLNEEQEGYYHEEGRINLLEGGRLEYTLKDHLGNGRVYCYHDAALSQAKAIQEAHYYPFGLPIQKLSPNFEAPVGVEANNYQYNGKELNEDFGLHWMDYGARWYDPQINRWGQVDPLAEKFYHESPYIYVGNNPVANIDVEGYFKLSASFIRDYPAFSNYIKNNITEVLKSGAIMNSLQNNGGFTRSTIEDDLKWDEGPTIVSRNLTSGKLKAFGHYDGRQSNGEFQIALDTEMLNQFEKLFAKENLPNDVKEAILMGLVSTLLHEYVHHGTGGAAFETEEMGHKFEIDAYGTKLEPDEGVSLKPAFYVGQLA